MAQAPAKKTRKYVVAQFRSIHLDLNESGKAKRYKDGDVLDLTAEQYRRFPRGTFEPYVGDDDENDDGAKD